MVCGKATRNLEKMAIYHTHISSGSRADGQSAAAKVAYILREGAYGGRDDLVDWGSGNMPVWSAADPRQLFAAADLYERANGRLFVHVWVALPNELTRSERHELVLAVAAALTEAQLPFVYAIHAGDPKSDGEPANPHVHFVISERINDGISRDARRWFRRANRADPAAGGAMKDRALKAVTWVEDARKRIEEQTNEHLARAGYAERVTADSHATRIAAAEARGDTEPAEYLRRHPPGIHLGPAAAAIERDRYRGRRGEEPELARPGEPTDRGEQARAKAAEEERVRGELARVSEALRRAREDERIATESVASARSAGLSDAEIVGVYEKSESVAAGSGWSAVAEEATLQAGRKQQAKAAAESLGIDVEAVFRGAPAGSGNAVAALERVIGIFEKARSALLADEEIARIHAEAESQECGGGWAAVEEETRARLVRKAAAEAAARAVGVEDITAVYDAARSRDADPVVALEDETTLAARARQAAEEREKRLDADLAVLRERRCEGVSDGGEWFYTKKLEELERGQRQSSPERRKQALAWAERQMDRLDALREAQVLDLFFGQLVEVGQARLPADIERSLDYAEEQQRAAAVRRQDYVDALSKDERVFFEEKLDALDPQWRETGTPKPAHVDVAVDYARARVVTLDEEIERRRAAIEETPGNGYVRLLAAGFAEASRQEKVEALAAMETALDEDFGRREERLRTAGEGEEFLRRGRLEVLGAADRQPETLPERGGVIEAAAAHQRRAARHQLISEAAESRRAAQRQDLFQQPGAEDLYYAWLADLDPTWVPGGQTAAANIDAALSATASDSGRLGLLRDVLADPVDAACYRAALYRAVLGVRRDRFTVADLDAAVAEALRRRAIAAARKREEEKRELEAKEHRAAREAKEHRAARYEALSDAGQELYTARLTALAPAGSRAGEPPGAVVARALDETESDGRLQDLEAIFADAEHRSYYRSLLVAAGDQVTLEQIDTALKATEAVVRRKQTIFEYPGNKEYPDGGALYAAAREALAPDWRPGAELPAGLLDQVESQLADRVRGAADIVEASIPTTQPWSHRPDYRVPAVSDELLDQLVQDDDNAFFKAVVAELRKRYARRAHYDTPSAERYDGAARQASQEKHLVPSWSTVLARVLKGYLSRLREIVLAACDRILGGDLGERLARRRTQVECAADAAEAGLPRTQPGSYGPQVPAVSDETLEQVVTDKSTPFLKEVVAEVRDRYDHREHAAAYEERYDHEARRNSERSHLNGAIENKHARAERLWWRRSSRSPRPTRESVEASVVKDHRSTVLEVFEVACDEVVGRGELGAQLREHRAQVQQAAAAAEKALPTTRPERYRPKYQVPAVSDETLEHAAAGKSDPFLEEVVAEVLARYDLRAGFDVAYEERYDHEARRNSERSHLNGAIENKHARAERLWWRRSSRSPRSTRESVEASVVKDHRSTVLEVFEVACDEVVGRGELGAQLREHRAQVQRVVDAVAPSLPATESYGRPGRHVPAVSDETLAEVRAGADAFLQKVVDLVWDRYDRCADYKTPREERYDDDDRRQSEDTCLAELIAKTLEGQRESRFSSTQQTAVRASALKDHRSRIRGIFMSARDDVLRGDELRDRQQERSVRPSGAQRAGGAGTSAGRRAATAPPSESPSTSPGHEREPHGRGQQRGKQQERAGQDSTTGHGGKGKQGERPRAAAAPAPAPAVVSVTEADRVRLAVYAVAAKLPRTQPYGNSSHRPPALSDERFNRMAVATDDEFVRKVIAAVQEKGNYYTDFERTESEKAHLRSAVGRMYQDALDEYEKVKAKRGIFSKRPPKPTWTEAEAAVIKEFISEQLGVIKEICREVQQRTPAAVRSELQRFEPGQVVTPRPSKSRTRATNQQGRGDSGPSR